MWKYLVTFLTILILSSSLYALGIPFSENEIKTENNHLLDFVRISPDDSLACPLPTDVWLWHNGKNLYVLWEAKIDNNFEKGTFATNDKYVDADFLRLQIITDVKNYYAYMFYAFPLGSKYDGIRNSNLNIDSGWNSTYEYKNDIPNNLWKCLMTIPVKDLRFYGKSPYNWKIILTRHFFKNDDYYSVPYGTTKMKKDYFRKAKDITIKEEITKSRNYRFRPYTIINYDAMDKDISFDWDNVGLDFSFNPGFSTKVKLSINPDFSDVPMDTEQDIYNMRYAPTYQENRYFFIEDLDVFGVGNNNNGGEQVFYSRHIMQPIYAFKITGNTAHYSYGFLSALDKKVTTDGEVTNPDDLYNMIAYKQKGENFNTQFTLLNRMNKDYHNEVLHIYPNWEFINNHSLWANVNLSLRRKENDIEKGYYGLFGYNGQKADIGWGLCLAKVSKNYAPDMGWINVTDLYAYNLNAWQNSEPNKKFLKEYGWSFWLHKAAKNKSNDLLEQNGGINFWFNTPQKINCWTNFNMGKEGYEDNVYDWYNLYLGGKWYKLDAFAFCIAGSIGKTLIYELSETHNKVSLDLDLWGKISKYLSYDISATLKKYFDLPTDTDLDDEYWIGNACFNINLSNNLSFTNSLRFNNYEYEDQTMHLGFFSNFRWEFKPDCNLYLGYKIASDEIDNKVEADYKQAYMKVSYTF